MTQRHLENHTEFKKQALELIISLYLNRKTDEDIKFMNDNIHSTQYLAKNVRSSLISGLTMQSLSINKEIYGENNQKQTKGISIKQIICEQLLNPSIILVFMLSICQIIIGKHFNYLYELQDGVWIIICLLIVITIRIALTILTQTEYINVSKKRKKNNLFRVLRQGEFIQINESKIVIGDIVQIGHRDKIPASGVLVSTKQIMINQETIGKDIQKKMNLQNCLNYIASLSNLELKLAYQNFQLPSSVLVRNTEVSYGTGRMLILSLDDEQLIKHNATVDKIANKSDKAQLYFTQLLNKWGYFSNLLIVIMIVFSIIFFSIRKWLLKETIYFEIIIIELMNLFMMILTAYTLFNKFTIKIFLKIRLTQFLIDVQYNQKLKQNFTAQQIIITEQNIVKYDKVNIQNIASFQKRDVITSLQINDLSSIQYNLFRKVLNAVFINESVFGEDQNYQGCKNKVIHTYKTYRRIVTQFQEVEDAQNYRYPLGISTSKQNQKNVNKLQFSRNQQELMLVMQANCKYTTQKILAGLMQIAEKKCKTYYYQKYSPQYLKNINNVLINDSIQLMNKDYSEKMKKMARKITLQHLVPILIGYSDGFENNSMMNILVGIIGISTQCQNIIVDQLIRLQQTGIKCIIMIPDENDGQKHIQQYITQYEGRQWLKFRQQQTCNMDKIRRAGGRLVCGSCLISNCDCKDRKEQLSNVLEFMKLTNSIKIIYGVKSEADIYYLECAYYQIKQTCINLTEHNSLALEAIEDIFRGYQLIESLQRGILCYIAGNFIPGVLVFIFGIFNGYSFFNRQMFGCFILLTVIPLIAFTAKLQIDVKKDPKRNRRQIKIFKKFSTFSIILLFILVAGVISLLYFYPYFIPQKNSQRQIFIQAALIDPSCKYLIQNTIIPAFAPKQCPLKGNSLSQPFYIYSKHSTILLGYLLFTINFFYMITFGNFKSCVTTTVYVFIFGLQTVIMFTGSVTFQTYFAGVNYIQYFIIIGLAGGTVLVNNMLAYIFEKCIKQYDNELQWTIKYDENLQKHYSTSLKKYLNYSNDFILMRGQQN